MKAQLDGNVALGESGGRRQRTVLKRRVSLVDAGIDNARSSFPCRHCPPADGRLFQACWTSLKLSWSSDDSAVTEPPPRRRADSSTPPPDRCGRTKMPLSRCWTAPVTETDMGCNPCADILLRVAQVLPVGLGGGASLLDAPGKRSTTGGSLRSTIHSWLGGGAAGKRLASANKRKMAQSNRRMVTVTHPGGFR